MKIIIKDLQFTYNSTSALDNVCFDVKASEIVAICGPNGSGKSTLIKCINRILEPNGGILIDNKQIEQYSLLEIAKMIGYVPQGIETVFPVTVFEMVLMGRKPHAGWYSTKSDHQLVSEVLHLMHLDHLANRDFNQLSGGERQKVIIARAIAQEPSILLLDEPTSHLDLKHQLDVMEFVQTLSKKRGLTVIMAIHDLNLASRFSDKILLLRNGKIFSAGYPDHVLTVENIKKVYSVEVIVTKIFDRPHIILVKSMNDSEKFVK